MRLLEWINARFSPRNRPKLGHIHGLVVVLYGHWTKLLFTVLGMKTNMKLRRNQHLTRCEKSTRSQISLSSF